MRPILSILLLAALTLAAGPAARAEEPDSLGASPSGFLEFTPDSLQPDSMEPPDHPESGVGKEIHWLCAPFGERLLTEPEAWLDGHHRGGHLEPVADYNRVDLFRFGLAGEAQDPSTMAPRIGGRYEYAFGRRRAVYGVQIEQPLLPHGRVAFGVSMSRRTDHNALQQVEDLENSLALVVVRQDYRDYFERDGFGTYFAWRVPDFSVVSLHVRNDTYRSLTALSGVHSIWNGGDEVRENPPVNEGDAHVWLVRLERQARRTASTRAGLYHWIEFERAGYGMGGDFQYTRALADVRSVLRLTPTTTLALRAVGGTTPAGQLPAQEEFMVGGVDGLRAHALAEFRGNQLLLAMAEYTTALMRVRTHGFDAGLHAIAFVDAGQAWNNPDHAWNPGSQHIEVDGGFGLATGDQNLRLYVARSLQRPSSSAVFSLRLQRPF